MNDIRSPGPSTPKNLNSKQIATSTVDRSKIQRRLSDLSTASMNSSLGLLSLKNVDLSNIVDVGASSGTNSVEEVRKQQRQLASETLNRVSRTSLGIPSRYFRPDAEQTNSETDLSLLRESTVNESDLLQTPRNTSTPRESSIEIEPKSGASRDSIFTKFRDMLDTDISTHDVVEQFKQSAQADRSALQTSVGNVSFVPAEKAESRLLADERSWRRQHELPQVLNSFCNSKTTNALSQDLSSISVGEFFQQKSDDISDLASGSDPSTIEPVALIDISAHSNRPGNSFVIKDNKPDQSLSVSAIQQMIAETSGRPSNIVEYLINQNKKAGIRKSTTQRESSDIFSLPVSRDESYTSSYSDNEAIRVAANEDKENQRPLTENKRTATVVSVSQPVEAADERLTDNRSVTPPSRSSSSLTSLLNGKLPIESTVNELVWGCVKIDRSVTKHFMVRNKTSKTLRLHCTVSSHEFKIKKDSSSDSDHLSSCKFVLHGNETRPLMVSFIPTKVGAATDELVFTPLDANLKQTKKQCVRLWGYGGHTSHEYQNVSRDNTGKYWLSLGKMDNSIQMERRFTVKNVGILPSFTYVKIIPKHMVTFTYLTVDPYLFVLLPNEEKTVAVRYVPTAKDCRVLKQNFNLLPVVDIARIDIVSGAEVSRARLRRMNRKCTEMGMAVDELTKTLAGKIRGELFPSDVVKFKEHGSAITEILETLSKEEMVITIEEDPNQTLVAACPEDSLVYQTLCADTTTLENLTIVDRKSCRLEPPSLVLSPPDKLVDYLFLTSESKKKMHFEVTCNPTSGLNINPSVGELSPGDTAHFKVSLVRNSTVVHFKVAVYVENDVFEAEVKVLKTTKTFYNRFLE